LIYHVAFKLSYPGVCPLHSITLRLPRGKTPGGRKDFLIFPLKMKRHFTLLIVILISLEGKSQLDTLLLTKNIYACEDSMIALFKRKDWKTYADYMNPKVIEMMGGKDGFVKYLKEQMRVLDEVDMQVYKTGKILQLVKINDQYQCIAESFMQMKMRGMTISGSSYDIAISDDGLKWTFFRITETATTAQIKEIFPGLSPDFKLPRAQMEPKTLDEFMTTYELKYLD